MSNIIISAGHVCLDITPVFPAGKKQTDISDLLVPGKLINTEAADVHTGGSVANTGLALKVLGNDVRLLGKIGKDAFGTMVKSIMANYGAGGLIEDENSDTSYSVVLAIPGIDRIFLHDPGANNSFVNADIPESALEDAVMFHFGYPTLMREMYAAGGAELVKIFSRVKSHGIATSLDLSALDPDTEAGKVDWRAILKKTLPYVDFFVPSFEEVCYMLDIERYNRLNSAGGDMTEDLDIMKEVVPLADELLGMGCKAVLIKCGISGMYYKTGDEQAVAQIGSRLGINIADWTGKEGVQPCFKADTVRSGAGAGDTSIAAFLTGVMDGLAPADCAAIAAAEGACCVTSYDALSGLKPVDELLERIKNGWPVNKV